jgi:glutaminyl-peptide cyclotransferase
MTAGRQTFGALLCAAAAVTTLALRAGAAAQPAESPDIVGVEVVHVYPHDRTAFTQGLIFREGFFYESTGLNGRSSLRKVEPNTGKVVQQRSVDARYFAEGLTDWGNQLLQLTWSSNVGFVYDLASFEPRRSFAYAGEGWGLTHDAASLIMSDGSSELRFIDPGTLKEQRRVKVLDRQMEVRSLNELEFVRGRIYANVWLTDRIAVIEPQSGIVTAWIDMSGVYQRPGPPGDDVLNGIAYDAATDRLFVTGKLWPNIFEIRPKFRAGQP